jgi:hypothetical protein
MTTAIQILMPSGIASPSVQIFDVTGLTVMETVTLTEHGTRKGLYTGNVTGSHIGWFGINKRSGTALIGSSWILLANDAGPYIEADPRTVDLSVSIAEIKAKTDLIGRITFLASGGVPDSNGTIRIKQGDRIALTLTSVTENPVPDLTGVTCRFGIKNTAGTQLISTTSVTVVVPTGFQQVGVVLLPTETLAMPAGAAFYDVQAEYSSTDKRTFATGSVTILADYSGA